MLMLFFFDEMPKYQQQMRC